MKGETHSTFANPIRPESLRALPLFGGGIQTSEGRAPFLIGTKERKTEGIDPFL